MEYNDKKIVIYLLKHGFFSSSPHILGPRFDAGLPTAPQGYHDAALGSEGVLGLFIESILFFTRKITAYKGRILAVFHLSLLFLLPFSKQFNLIPINLTPQLRKTSVVLDEFLELSELWLPFL